MNLIVAETEVVEILIVRKNKKHLGLCPQYNLAVGAESGYEVCEKMLFMLSVACSFKERTQTPIPLLDKYLKRKHELLHLVQMSDSFSYTWRTLEEGEWLSSQRVYLNSNFLPDVKEVEIGA